MNKGKIVMAIKMAAIVTVVSLAAAIAVPVLSNVLAFGRGRAEKIIVTSFVAGSGKASRLVVFEESRIERIEFTKPLDGFNWIVFSKEAKVGVDVPCEISYSVDMLSPDVSVSYDAWKDVLFVKTPAPIPGLPAIHTDKVISQIIKRSALIDEAAALAELKTRLTPIIAERALLYASEPRVLDECRTAYETALKGILATAARRAPKAVSVTFLSRINE